MTASNPDLEFAAAIPIEFDVDMKLACLRETDPVACTLLKVEFIGASNFSGDAQALIARVAFMRGELHRSFADLTRKFSKCNFTLHDLTPGVVQVARTWNFFAAVLERRQIADEVQFWHKLMSMNPAGAFLTFFKAVKTYDEFHSLCGDVLFSRMLTQNLTSACAINSSWSLVDELVSNYRLSSNDSLRRLFWSHVAVIDPQYSTVRSAALAVPLEFNAQHKLQCSLGSHSSCLTLVSSFVSAVAMKDLRVKARDNQYPEAQLHAFSRLMKTINVNRTLINHDRGLAARINALLTESRVSRPDRFFQFMTRTGSAIAAEASLTRGLERFFNYISPTSNIAVFRWFWQIHFRVKSVEELEANMRALILEKRVMDPLLSGFRYMCQNRNSRQAINSSNKPVLVTLREACISTPSYSAGIIDLFTGDYKTELQTRLQSWWDHAAINDWFLHVVDRELRFDYTSDLIDGETLGDCTICMEPITSTNSSMFTPCEHRYHSLCLLQWMANRRNPCPLCRSALPLPRM